ncbi:uncharacterized protein LOC130711199 isoform X3 [Lotus japonicus]|uniref:uncharacterized protein LOC130711199 isoform X3 n=2 Tax=Lotus japonicus TaxID=34305 RepID=UPI00258440DC|nr:uncharacterized protein LOC130711199 isoform X3 [Lotus japonicus]
MWNTPARYLPTVQSCTEVILLDKEGSKIQASVCKDHRLRGEIFTGFVYKISKFKVIPNTRELRCTSHGYRLVFSTRTILTLSGDTSIPREGWSFYDTGYIERCRGIFSHLSDFIGVVSSVSAVRRFVTEGKTTKMMIVELRDSVGIMRCFLYGELAELLMLNLCSNWTKRPVLILQFIQVRNVNGLLFMRTLPHTSKLFVNPGFEVVSSFTNRLYAGGIRTDEPVQFLRPRVLEVNMRQDMLNLHPKKTISQLSESDEFSQEAIYIVHGGIVAALKNEAWTYPSCICHGELIVRTGVYECVTCQRFFYTMIHRYRVNVEVFDGHESAVFVLNHSEVQELLKLTPERVFSDLEVLRICSDVEIISAFHTEETIPNALEVIGNDGNQSEAGAGDGESSKTTVISKQVKRKLDGEVHNGNHDNQLKFNSDDYQVRKKTELTIDHSVAIVRLGAMSIDHEESDDVAVKDESLDHEESIRVVVEHDDKTEDKTEDVVEELQKLKVDDDDVVHD